MCSWLQNESIFLLMGYVATLKQSICTTEIYITCIPYFSQCSLVIQLNYLWPNSQKGYCPTKSLWLRNAYFQSPFCTVSQWNVVFRKSYYQALIRYWMLLTLYKMAEWQVIKCKHLINIILSHGKVVSLKIKSHFIVSVNKYWEWLFSKLSQQFKLFYKWCIMKLER